MATLLANVPRIGTYLGEEDFACNGSIFAVGATRIKSINASGVPVSWRNGSPFNNLSPTGNKDKLTPGTAFVILPTSAIVTDDKLFSFNTEIETKNVNSNSFLF
ncbi:MAG TPA: hypothetical protein V6C63_01100 [Allocoleopsis sp.]